MKAILSTLVLVILPLIAFAHNPIPIFGIHFNGNALLLLPTSGKNIITTDAIKMNGISGEDYLKNRQENPELSILIENMNKIGDSWFCQDKMSSLLSENQYNSLRIPLENNLLGPIVIFDDELTENSIKCFWN